MTTQEALKEYHKAAEAGNINKMLQLLFFYPVLKKIIKKEL